MSRTDSSSDSPAQSSEETSRRRLLALLGAGGGAGLAALVSLNQAEAGHDATNVFHLGEDNVNPTGTSTSLSGAGPTTGGGSAALEISGGVSVGGQSGMGNAGRALRILNTDDNSHDGALTVNMASTEGPALDVYGAGNAITGFSGGEGEEPPSGAGIGVHGASGSGTGARGRSEAGVGVEASSPDGLALLVDGASAFSTVGSGSIAAGQNSATVANSAVTDDSHISVTLTSDPGPRQIVWVSRDEGTGFTVNLSSAPANKRPQTSFTYLIVEPAP